MKPVRGCLLVLYRTFVGGSYRTRVTSHCLEMFRGFVKVVLTCCMSASVESWVICFYRSSSIVSSH